MSITKLSPIHIVVTGISIYRYFEGCFFGRLPGQKETVKKQKHRIYECKKEFYCDYGTYRLTGK